MATLKREKKFIQDKLEKVQSSEELVETNRLLEIERSKSEVAEKARAQLSAELDNIKKQLDKEQDNIDSCRRFLIPEDLAKIEESHPEKSSSPSSTDAGLTISEKILLKYKRSNELRNFFETCYQSQNKQVKEQMKRISHLEDLVQSREQKVDELKDEVNKLEVIVDHFKDEIARLKEMGVVDK